MMITINLTMTEDQFEFEDGSTYVPETNMEMTFSEEATWTDVMKGLFKTLKVAGYLFDKESVLEHIENNFDDIDF